MCHQKLNQSEKAIARFDAAKIWKTKYPNNEPLSNLFREAAQLLGLVE